MSERYIMYLEMRNRDLEKDLSEFQKENFILKENLKNAQTQIAFLKEKDEEQTIQRITIPEYR